MNAVAMSDQFPGAVLSVLAASGVPDIGSCDTLVAQCLDALPMVIQVMDARGRVVFYNRAAYRYFGPRIVWARWPRERDQLFHHDDGQARRNAREKVIRSGLRVRVALRAVRYDYTPIWHAFDLTPLFDKASLVTGVLISMTEMHDTDRAATSAGPLDPTG